ncbi:MAG: GIY-YIG nuclease family protein [Gemmatimonadaceae bacterium]
MRQYSVYILASRSRQLYIGVTNNLELRVAQHRVALRGFTAERRINQLVYYELTGDVRVAIQREKQLKGWRRLRKLRLVESMNPTWKDLLPQS